MARKKRNPESPELIVKRQEFGEWYRRRRLETGFKGNELEPRVSRGQGYVSKVEGGVYPIQKDSICLLDMPVFIALGSIDDARKLLEGLEPMFGSIDKSLLEQIAAKASDYPDFWPRDSIDRDSIRRFAASIPEAFSSIPSLPKTESKPLPVEEKPLVSQPTQQRYVPLLIPPVPESEILTLDEMNLLILREESRQPDPKAMVGFWNLVGEAVLLPWLCQRSMLALALKHWDENLTVNHLEYLFLDAMVVETARRYSGQAEPLPTQLETVVRDLGCVAWLAIHLSEGNEPTPKISLANLQEHWPQSRVGDWGWLRQIARIGPTQLIVHEDGVCEFRSQVEAEFWAARYLLSISLDEILRIARSMGRPFGILRQAVSHLHFTHRDDMVQKVIETLLENSEPQQLQIRYLDAADLLAVCEAKTNQILRFLWKTVTEELCRLWEEIESPEWRDQVAQIMRHLDCDPFRRMMKQILYSDTKLVERWKAALRGCAILGGSFAVETLKSMIADRVLKTKTPASPINADEMRDKILVATSYLPPIERALLLEFGATLDADYSAQYLQALSNAGNVPALCALQRLAKDENVRRLNGKARWKLEEGYTPAYVALMAHELESCRNQKTSPTYQQVARGRFLLQSSFAAYRESSADSPSSFIPRTLAQELAQLWATIELDNNIRAEAALGLTLAQAWPALEICLTTLPLVNQPDAEKWPTDLLPDLLLRLSSPENKSLLERLLSQVVDLTQRALLVRCLGRAGGVVLDERFESELSQPQDDLAAAAVEAIAYSLGMAAESRLKQIAATDQREAIRRQANEMLAFIGSEAALPYLQARLTDPQAHNYACSQLAYLHHPQAEELLIQEAKRSRRDKLYLYLSTLAVSGGAVAVDGLRDILGPEPGERLWDVQRGLAQDRVLRAGEAWLHLTNDTSPDWKKIAIEVLAKDKRQTLIHKVLELALDAKESEIRSFAWHCLRYDVPAITSEVMTQALLSQIQSPWNGVGLVDKYCLELLQKCLRGLSTGGQPFPAEIRAQVLGVLKPLLELHREPEMRTLIMAALAFPDFAEADKMVDSCLPNDVAKLKEIGLPLEAMLRQGVQTLVEMESPRMWDWLIKLCQAKNESWRDSQKWASRTLAERAESDGLLHLSSDLRAIVYTAAVIHGIRFKRAGMRNQAIYPNGEIVNV